jgi:type II secretory pathway component PulF
MPDYSCRISDKKGRISEIIRSASSETVLLRDLNSEGLFPLGIKTCENLKKNDKSGGIKKRHIIDFTETLSIMMESGLSLKDALAVSSAVFTKGPLKELSAGIKNRLEKGMSFSAALEAEGSVFPPVYKGLAGIGEKAGTLETVFAALSGYLKDEKKIRDKISTSLFYPVLVLIVAFSGMAGIILFIFPRIQTMFSQLGQSVPEKMTSMMSNINIFFSISLFISLSLALAVVILSVLRKARPDLKLKTDAVILKLPLLGQLVSANETLNFCFAMQTLTEASVRIEEALKQASNVCSNAAYRTAIMEVKTLIEKGGTLSAAFSLNSVFPQRLVSWTAVGEKSGHPEKIFYQLKSYYQSEIEKWTARFMNLAEPVLIVLVGLVIMLMIMFFVVPVFSMYGSILG